jgi:hypothetical protein
VHLIYMLCSIRRASSSFSPRTFSSTARLSTFRPLASSQPRNMGKNSKAKKNAPVLHSDLLLPQHASGAGAPIIDTHTHLLSTFSAYRAKYPSGPYESIYDFIAKMYEGRNVEAIVDVWCEAPVLKEWKELAEAALDEQRWGETQYYFVMGAFSFNGLVMRILTIAYDFRCSSVSFLTQPRLALIQLTIRHNAKDYDDAVEAEMCVYISPRGVSLI